ncbi:hypothetical protein [Corynebacterium cystitidis]|uniref:hypothetical protein n=1 Tax=Corynebacterium cystitidis TaxID=35757 RepID=UPI00211E708E|nr:hypothetical protein [Corynebacterium cystitidis]
MTSNEATREMIEEARIEDIRLVTVNADARNYEELPETVRVEFEMGGFHTRAVEFGIMVRVQANARFCVEGEKEGESASTLAEISLLYEVDVSMPPHLVEQCPPPADVMTTIIDSKIAPFVYPYVRAKVHTLSTELPLPTTLIPAEAP